MITEHSGFKYLRIIRSAVDPSKAIRVDIYRIIDAYEVIDPGLQHAIKKILCPGVRGKGTMIEDLTEARNSLDEAIKTLQAPEPILLDL